MAKLYNHQQRLIDKNPSQHLLCWACGTGKTLAAISWANYDPARNVIIVICPKALKENWMREINKHKDGGVWTVLTKEEFRRDWKSLPNSDTVIVDECHHFSSMKSQMSKSLSKYFKKHEVKYRLLLTATPYMSTPWNIFVLSHHLGKEINYMRFKMEFFTDVRMGARFVPVIRKGMEPKIASLIADIGDTVRLDECVDVPDQVFITERFKMTKKQNKMIEDTMEVNPIVKYTRHHQIEQGTLKSDGYSKDESFKCDKNDRILELAIENKKIAIICRYNLQIKLLSELLKKAKKPIYIIQGGVKDRDSVVREADASNEAIVLINAACSEGYELPSIGVIVFASLSFSYKDYEQITGRFLRINKLKKNVYIHLITDEGVDEAVYKSMMKKQDFSIEIYERKRLSN